MNYYQIGAISALDSAKKEIVSIVSKNDKRWKGASLLRSDRGYRVDPWVGDSEAGAVDWYESVIAIPGVEWVGYYGPGDQEPRNSFRKPSDLGTIKIYSSKDWIPTAAIAGLVGIAVGAMIKGK